ncbi:hypothetical protein CC1G_15770 [Coprinopsis cinerea okayama7|uniref:Uncharacterized protein n=1 Tax=Coprinopsis cinerea (strain Okayama-7 / 130 / ATCC MYA-4618 / FGSC 9003) TaxID=240176 RepID=D6RQY4_COPC7|nr:hypothetical protein CC1G_15770 [Coprinopsis cinerea okayama7\|eukprot:XP_002910051.1 hypothetical protein CC1G_15770 [Coprinopsis cinerea okayama7\
MEIRHKQKTDSDVSSSTCLYNEAREARELGCARERGTEKERGTKVQIFAFKLRIKSAQGPKRAQALPEMEGGVLPLVLPQGEGPQGRGTSRSQVSLSDDLKVTRRYLKVITENFPSAKVVAVQAKA